MFSTASDTLPEALHVRINACQRPLDAKTARYAGFCGLAGPAGQSYQDISLRMEQFAKETLLVSLEAEMRHSYLDYAMSVIVGRALPDVRDGLKPVHRRVLYAMHEANIAWNRPYVKCARVVGDVRGWLRRCDRLIVGRRSGTQPGR